MCKCLHESKTHHAFPSPIPKHKPKPTAAATAAAALGKILSLIYMNQHPSIKSILKKLGDDDLIEKLSGKISSSEFQTLMLEVFRRKSKNISVADVVEAYKKNRFVQPAKMNAVDFGEFENDILRAAEMDGFEPLLLSPLAPLGSCSVIALADQNKIVSSLRGTEVVADATNMLALEYARRKKENSLQEKITHLCAAHRHTRAQVFNFEGFSPHFSIFCLASAGKDEGNFNFEKITLKAHLQFYIDLLSSLEDVTEVVITLKSLEIPGKENMLAQKVIDAISDHFLDFDFVIEKVNASDHAYYQSLRFNIQCRIKNEWLDIGDGGFVNWAALLLNDHKQRMLTSAVGTERLFKTLAI